EVAGQFKPVEFPELGVWAIHIRNWDGWKDEWQPVGKLRQLLIDTEQPADCDVFKLTEFIDELEDAKSVYIVDCGGTVTVLCSHVADMFFVLWDEMTEAWANYDRHRQRIGLFEQHGSTAAAVFYENQLVQFRLTSDPD
ncbi:MAG: hypothetical protein AAB538_00780, partial [Patescibacteria group bacterium]